MQYRTEKGFSGGASLGILFALAGVGLILTSLMQLIIAFYLAPPGAGLQEAEGVMKNMMDNPDHAGWIMLIQGLGTLLLMFLPSCLSSAIVHGKAFRPLGFNRHFDPIQLLLAFVIIFSANLIAVPFEQISKSIAGHFPSIYEAAVKMETEYSSQLKILASMNSVSGAITGIFMLALLPALFEESFFRGYIQNLFSGWWRSPVLAVIVTSVIFSLVHFSIFLFVGRALLGVALGLIFLYTRNIWVVVIAHFLNNCFAFIQFFLSGGKAHALQPSSGSFLQDGIYALAGLAAAVFLFRYLKKRSAGHIMNIPAEAETGKSSLS